MKKIVLIATMTALILATIPSFAQTTWFGTQGSAVLPTSDLKEITKSGGGGSFHLDQATSKS